MPAEVVDTAEEEAFCEPGGFVSWAVTDVATEAGVQDHLTRGRGVALADYSGDGWLDLYTANQDDPARLFINQGDGTFRSQADPPQVSPYTTGVTAADYDNDGDIDIFVSCGGFLALCSNGLLRNDGLDGEVVVFTHVSAAAGFDSVAAASFGAAWLDFDRDGWLDLYVGNKDISLTWEEGMRSRPQRAVTGVTSLPRSVQTPTTRPTPSPTSCGETWEMGGSRRSVRRPGCRGRGMTTSPSPSTMTKTAGWISTSRACSRTTRSTATWGMVALKT